MANYNKVILIGRLVKDPETKKTQTGKSVCDIYLAVNRTYKDSQGQKHEEADFISIQCWGNLADICQTYLEKSSEVMIEGELRLDQWESENGEKRSKLKVVAENVQFLSRKKAEEL